MIRVDVEEYCHQCMDFHPDVIPPVRCIGNDDKSVTQTDTVIQCKYRKRCASIERYLKQRIRDESSD